MEGSVTSVIVVVTTSVEGSVTSVTIVVTSSVEGSVTSVTIVVTSSVEAVSYTHLDVYKRQPLWFLPADIV